MDIANILDPISFLIAYQIYGISRLTDKQKINSITYHVVTPLIDKHKIRLQPQQSKTQISKIILENLKLNYK